MKWPEVHLGRAVNIVKGKKPLKVSERQSSECPQPYVTIEAFESGQPKQYASVSSSEVVTKDGDVLIVWDGARYGLIGRSIGGVLGSTLGMIQVPSIIDKGFVYYFLKSQYGRLRSVKRGSGIPHLDGNYISKLLIPLPPFSEQRRIVEILDQADALRKRRAEADAKAACILPALFYMMFGDPVTNPKGWPTERLSELFDVVGGGTPLKAVSEYWSGDIPWVSPKDMKNDVIVDTKNHITEEAITNSATRLIKRGSILVVYRSGILAHSFPVAIAGCDVSINQDLKALTSKSSVCNEYLYGWLSASPSVGLSCVKQGATVHNVDGSRFLGLQITKPPKAMQESFSIMLKNFLEQKIKRRLAEMHLEELFSVLIHGAFTGDLTAKWREAHMKELLEEMEQQGKLLEIEEG